MKIRTGFVTNSSSVSFCVVGTTFDSSSEMLELIRKSEVPQKLSEESWKRLAEELDCDTAWALESIAQECGIKGLEIRSDDYTYWIGFSIHSMQDNETLSEFKQRAAEALHTLGLMNKLTALIQKKIGIHTHGYYNG